MRPGRSARTDGPPNVRFAAYALLGMGGILALGSVAMLVIEPHRWAQALAGLGPAALAIAWAVRALGEDEACSAVERREDRKPADDGRSPDEPQARPPWCNGPPCTSDVVHEEIELGRVGECGSPSGMK